MADKKARPDGSVIDGDTSPEVQEAEALLSENPTIVIVDNMNAEVWGEVIFEGRPYYVTEDRQWVRLLDVNPMLIQMATSSVKPPKKPTYEVTTMSGRVETFPIDDEVAASDKTLAGRWAIYKDLLAEFTNDANMTSMRAMLFYGTEFTPPDTGWEESQELFGIEVPKRPELRKAHYLMTCLSLLDMNHLLQVISRRMGVSEASIKQAEDSFRGTV